MAQAELKKPEPKVCVDPNLIILEELPIPEVLESIEEEKPVKRGLRKLLRKIKYNAKAHEEMIPIDKINSEWNHRNYGIF